MGSQPPSSTGALPPTLDDLSADVPVYPLTKVPGARLHLGALQEAPDIVVIMHPRAALPPEVPHPSAQEETATSPERRFQARDEETAPDERLCIQAWVLCAAVTFPLVFSSWLLLVPYLVRSSGLIPPGGGQWFTLPSFPSQSAPAPTFSLTINPSVSLPTATSTTPRHHSRSIAASEFTVPTYLPPSTKVTSPATTTDVWTNVPGSCLNPPPVPLPPSNLRVGPHYSGTRSNQTFWPFFCMYNNYYVSQRTTPWHFMFETLPFALCPYVIYWSVGIVNGSLTSRLPSFDRQHGLHQLRNITDRLGFPRIKILLALGGYEEDAPHFSRLGRDIATMNRLMQSVTDAMTYYRLNGVTVDWSKARTGCDARNDTDVLALLLHNLRRSFDHYGVNHIVSLIVRPERAYEAVMNNVANAVDYFFLGKWTLAPHGPAVSTDFCSRLTGMFHTDARRNAQNAPRVFLDQLCIVQDLSLFSTYGNMDMRTRTITTASYVYSGNFYSMCTRPSFCRNDSAAGSCVSHFAFTGQGTPTRRPIQYITASSSATLRDRADLSRLRGPSNSTSYTGPCVLAVNLQMDNFAEQCGPHYNQYILTEHLYYAILGQNVTGGSLQGAAPEC